MTDDLVQRLRTIPDRAIFVKGGLVYEDYEDVMEAADRIEEMDRHLILSGKMSKALSDRIEALEEDIERLRERVKRVENNNRELRGSKERVYAATDLRQPTQSDVLREKIKDIKEAWDWWQEDTLRCASVVEDAIDTALQEQNK